MHPKIEQGIAEEQGEHDDSYEVAVVFADVVGSTKYSDIERTKFRGILAKSLRPAAEGRGRRLDVYHINTWGDAVFTLVANPWRALKIARELRTKDGPQLRIALDFGKAIHRPSGIFDGWDGEPISRCARLEPVTPRGRIWATAAFADAYKRQSGMGDEALFEDLSDHEIGEIVLPKGYGQVKVYDVTTNSLEAIKDLQQRHNTHPSLKIASVGSVLKPKEMKHGRRRRWDDKASAKLKHLTGMVDRFVVGSPRAFILTADLLQYKHRYVDDQSPRFAFIWDSLPKSPDGRDGCSIAVDDEGRLKQFGVPAGGAYAGIVWHSKEKFQSCIYATSPPRALDFSNDVSPLTNINWYVCRDYAVLSIFSVNRKRWKEFLGTRGHSYEDPFAGESRSDVAVCIVAGHRGPGTLGGAMWLLGQPLEATNALRPDACLLIEVDYHYVRAGAKEDARKLIRARLLQSLPEILPDNLNREVNCPRKRGQG